MDMCVAECVCACVCIRVSVRVSVHISVIVCMCVCVSVCVRVGVRARTFGRESLKGFRANPLRRLPALMMRFIKAKLLLLQHGYIT